jgi:YbbR domain-containing protein
MLRNLKYGKVDRRMNNIFSRNLGWKITSIILAFLLWFAVVRYQDPSVTKEFKDIPVNVKNEQLITPKKSIIYKEGQYVTVKLRGKRSVMDKLGEEDIEAVANMKYMSYLYSVKIDIITEDKSIEVIEKSPDNMVVELENIKTENRKITLEIDGDPHKSYRALEPIISPNTIEITGPESKVAMVSKALARVSLEGASNDISSIGMVVLLDENGNMVEKIDKSVDEVKISIPIRKLKTINLEVNPVGKLPSGYKLTGSQVIPSRVTLIGKEDIINKIGNRKLNIPLDGITSDTSIEYDLSTVLPNNVSRDDGSNLVTVKLEVDKIEEKAIEIAPHDISIVKPPEGLIITPIKDNITVLFKGISDDLNKIHVYSLNPNVNLNNLEEGQHEIDLNLTYPDNVELVSDIPKIRIELTKEKETTTEEKE